MTEQPHTAIPVWYSVFSWRWWSLGVETGTGRPHCDCFLHGRWRTSTDALTAPCGDSVWSWGPGCCGWAPCVFGDFPGGRGSWTDTCESPGVFYWRARGRTWCSLGGCPQATPPRCGAGCWPVSPRLPWSMATHRLPPTFATEKKNHISLSISIIFVWQRKPKITENLWKKVILCGLILHF